MQHQHDTSHHTWSHLLLNRMAPSAAEAEIDRGIAAVEGVLYGRHESQPKVPFFRFPGFASSAGLLDRLARRHLAVFDADLWASDWNPMRPEVELRLVLDRLEQRAAESCCCTIPSAKPLPCFRGCCGR